jgi:hypothetical protein
MGQYDDIPPEQIRADLVRFARLLLRLEEEGRLLRSIPHIQAILGDLRQKLFAHEVRGTRHLPPAEKPPLQLPPSPAPAEAEDVLLRDSMRVVKEARERQEEAIREWSEPDLPGEDDLD